MNKTQKQNIVGVLSLINKPVGGVFKHRIRLQKLVLLAKEELGYPFDFTYRPYYYGPFSRDLQHLLKDLVDSNYINEHAEEMPNGNFEFFYSLTTLGEKKMRELKKELGDNYKKIDATWDKYSNQSTSAIVSAAKKLPLCDC